jgi:hypothetical protein
MPGRKRSGGKPPKRPIERYEHSDKKRINNPPVGLVTPETDPVAPTHKTYDYVAPVPSVKRKRLTNPPVRSLAFVLKFPDERRTDKFASQKTYAGRGSEAGRTVPPERNATIRFLPRQTLESQHSGTPSAKVERERPWAQEADDGDPGSCRDRRSQTLVTHIGFRTNRHTLGWTPSGSTRRF